VLERVARLLGAGDVLVPPSQRLQARSGGGREGRVVVLGGGCRMVVEAHMAGQSTWQRLGWDMLCVARQGCPKRLTGCLCPHTKDGSSSAAGAGGVCFVRLPARRA